MRSDLLDLSVVVHHQTARAILVSDTGERAKAVWLPLAAVEINSRKGAVAEITLPERLAIDKGLV